MSGADELESQGRDSDADRTGMSRELLAALAAHPEEMATLIAGLSARVTDHPGLLELLGRGAAQAVRLLPGAHWAGVTVQFDDLPFTVAHTDDRVLVVDELQYRQGNGPCLSSLRTGTVVQMTSEAVTERWPGLAADAETAGVRAFLAAPLTALGVPTAALNLYSADPDGLTDPDHDVLTVLVEYLNRGLADYCLSQPEATRGVRLRQALQVSKLLQHASGILMARHRLDSTDARELLHQQARRRGDAVWRYATDLIAEQAAATRPAGGLTQS